MRQKYLFVRSWYRDCTVTLYANVPQAQIDRIQSVFNGVARLIFGASRFSHIKPLLRDRLHRLRCPDKICNKLCVTVFRAFHGMAPDYIADLCLTKVISESCSAQRSASTSGVRLALPRRSSCARFGDRAFLVAGQTTWNSLPERIALIPTLDSFKRQLKT